MKLVFRNFSLSKIHPYAFNAAVATEAAGLLNKFWEMHDIIFENQETLDAENILLLAKTIGLNSDRFKHDIQEKVLVDKVEHNFESGIRSGVNKTPSFFINGKKYEGSWEEMNCFSTLKAANVHKIMPCVSLSTNSLFKTQGCIFLITASKMQFSF